MNRVLAGTSRPPGTAGFFLFVAVSLLLSSYVAVIVLPGPTATITGDGSDHFSHAGSAVLFWERGSEIWRRPIVELCPRHDACHVPNRPTRLLHINWGGYPRPYPPGALAYAAPEALLYALTALSFETINRISILKYLAVAHLLLAWLLWTSLAIASPGEQYPSFFSPRGFSRFAVSGTLFFLLWCEVFRHSFFGIYDGVAIAAVMVSVSFLERDRPLDALLAMSAALFLHFRAIWFLPLLVHAGWACLRTQGTLRGRAAVAKLAAALALLFAFGASLSLAYPSLDGSPLTNPLRASARGSALLLLCVCSAMGGLLALAALRRNWLLLACGLFQFAVVARTPQVMPWHSLFLLPILSVAGLRRGKLSLAIAVAIYFVQATWIFDARPQPKHLYRPLLELLGSGGTSQGHARGPAALTMGFGCLAPAGGGVRGRSRRLEPSDVARGAELRIRARLVRPTPARPRAALNEGQRRAAQHVGLRRSRATSRRGVRSPSNRR